MGYTVLDLYHTTGLAVCTDRYMLAIYAHTASACLPSLDALQEDADDIRGTTTKDEIYERDYSAPTGEDAWLNKELLPKVMQVGSCACRL